MLILKSATLKNIGRFTEPQTIDFTQLGSLVQVEGKNSVTGGSSGAGKSTIFKAINWCLGLDGPSTTILQSRFTKEPIEVSLSFDYNGLPLTVERGKKLSININGEITTGSSKLTEEKLDSILGMPRELFSRIIHKKQGEGGFFLQLGPSDVHKFLVDCLSLQKEQEKVKTLETKLTLLEKSSIEASTSWSSAVNGVDATNSALSILGLPPTLEVDPKVLQELKNSYKSLLDHKNTIESHYILEMEELEKSRPKVETVPFDRTGIEATESNINSILSWISELEKVELKRQSKVKDNIAVLQEKINQLNGVEKDRQNKIQQKIYENRSSKSLASMDVSTGQKSWEKAVGLNEELKKIRASMCPTCEQNWITDAAKAKEAELVRKLQEYKLLVMAGKEASKKVEALDLEHETLRIDVQPKAIHEIQDLNGQIAQFRIDYLPQAIPEVTESKMKIEFYKLQLIRLKNDEKEHQFKENAKSQAIVVNFAKKQTVVRENHEMSLRKLQEDERELLNIIHDMEYKIRSFEEATSKHSDSLSKLNSQLGKYQTQFEKAEKELKLIKEEIFLAEESKKAIKSYISCSFEDALESIGDMATKLIRSIPNMSTATIQFEGLKETKEGKLKEEVNCLISMDGEIGIPVKSLSGGERSSTDLAIDISVIKFIEERTGNGIDLFILDEAFTGMDSKNIVEALEMLKEISLDKRLMIVDHNPEASQFLESRLTIVRDGLTSRIVQ